MHGGPVALALGVVVAAGAVAALVATRRGAEADAVADGERALAAAPLGPGAAAAPRESELAAALDRMAAALERIEATLARMEGRDGAGSAPAASGATAAGGASAAGTSEPWYRRRGAVIDWLPPEGVPLVKAWYRERLGDRMDGTAGLDREQWERQLAALDSVQSELELARWIEDRCGIRQPSRLDLAEFAAQRAGK